jgi:hypothetical protein
VDQNEIYFISFSEVFFTKLVTSAFHPKIGLVLKCDGGGRGGNFLSFADKRTYFTMLKTYSFSKAE